MKKFFALCLLVIFIINSVDALTCKGKTVHEVALEVIRGDWGNGNERTRNFNKYNCKGDAIQREVNRILSQS